MGNTTLGPRLFAVGLIFVSAVMLSGATAWAQSRISPRSFSEDLRTSVPHAGSRALGIIADGKAATNFGSVFVRIRGPLRGNICVSVNSIDGLYVASATYAVDSKPGLVTMAFPTQKLGSSARYRDTDLVIGIRVGGCGDARQPFMIGTWQPPEQITRIGFAVNAGAGAKAFTIEPGRGRVDCDPASRLRSSADNATMTHVCWVSTEKLAQSASLKVFRETPAGRSEIIFPLQGGGPAPKAR